MQRRYGQIRKDSGFIFTKDDGTPMHPDSITDWLVHAHEIALARANAAAVRAGVFATIRKAE